ncbi:Nudix hydrolase domain-containing protein [Plasmodiophora brassicae]|uniref:Nudix hydrolase domain-containing protein n=1 Tax=Plasmodiophora brassicae TaxID=37360 RepID=A0A0G4IU73_PLABS|nr:hypothetical protein PBRA_007012 [Plasmodiophora brassicae]SPQ92969.1 unnamed protein product [Plasmodiophora brassicae]
MTVSTELAVALDDLSSRFFLNLPAEELSTFERLFFQLEQAWWFYEDFYHDRNPRVLPKFSFKDFCMCLFEHAPALRPHVPNFETHFAKFREYLLKVPVCGAIMLDESMTSCVLVKGWTGKSWGFPKGKINQGEALIDCAVREVLEETGVSIADLVSDQHVIQASVRGTSMSLFIAPNVPSNVEFVTQTRKEISDIRWFRVDSLGESSDTKFWNVAPFIHKLRTWISRHRHLANKSRFDDTGVLDRRCHSAPSSKSRRRRETKPSPMIQQAHQRRIKSSFIDVDSNRGRNPSDFDTFGYHIGSWSAEEMFEANERLFGVHSTACADPNELAASMALSGSMTGSVQRLQAKSSLLNSPLPSSSTSSCAPERSAGKSRSSGNVLLNFDLDDAGIMSHFFQA